MNKEPVILILDVGKTNKKVLLFNQQYQLVLEESSHFEEIFDEDNFPTENLYELTNWVFTSVNKLLQADNYEIRAIHFSGYGASLVCLDLAGNPVFPLYNYLKPFPADLKNGFFEKYGNEEKISMETCSPMLGNLNSGLQLYRLKHLFPSKFDNIEYALHLPEYLSYILTKKHFSNMTSIGCHTMLWNFGHQAYHSWVQSEFIHHKLAPIKNGDEVAGFFSDNIPVGVGLHDSSAALIPYLSSFSEPFLLISTGTWCISMNAFNDQPITMAEFKQDVLCYMTYQGKPVKSSRLFAGNEHEIQVKRLSEFFKKPNDYFKSVQYDSLKDVFFSKEITDENEPSIEFSFSKVDLNQFSNYESAYHALILNLVELQVISSNLVLLGAPVKKIFVDGGFGKNVVFMNMLAKRYPRIEVYSSVVSQASALGAAMAIHSSWNSNPIPTKLIELKRFI